MALLPVATVNGAEPFITDDPKPEEPGHWEINLASENFRTAEGWSGHIFHADVSVGILPDLELNFLAPLAYDALAHGPTHVGYGDTELGFKYRFMKEKTSHVEAAFAPIVYLPTGNHHFDLGNGKAQLFLPLWLQKTLGKWTVYGGSGYTFNPGDVDNHDFWYAGLVVNRKISEKLALGLEFFHFSPDKKGGISPTGLNFGIDYDFSEHYHLLAAAGHSIEGRSEFTGYLALQITLGPDKKKEAVED